MIPLNYGGFLFALQVDLTSPGGTAVVPARATAGSFGYDLSLSEDVTVLAGKVQIGQTDLKLLRDLPLNSDFQHRTHLLEPQEGLAMLILPRSSLALRWGLLIPNSPGLIDADYTGEIGILLHNFRDEDVTVPAGTRVAQALFVRAAIPFVMQHQTLSTDRQERGGFGSTGR